MIQNISVFILGLLFVLFCLDSHENEKRKLFWESFRIPRVCPHFYPQGSMDSSLRNTGLQDQTKFLKGVFIPFQCHLNCSADLPSSPIIYSFSHMNCFSFPKHSTNVNVLVAAHLFFLLPRMPSSHYQSNKLPLFPQDSL